MTESIKTPKRDFRLYLTGFPGCGKSYIGSRLATVFGLNFCDLDIQIEQNARMTIPEIFEKFGEDHFRNLEKEALSEVSELQNTVIATGGGAPCFFENMEIMNETGVTVFLNVSVPVLISRLKKETETRPLLAGKTDEELAIYIRQKLNQRLKFYEKAHLIYDIKTGNEPIIDELSVFIRRMSA